MCADLRSEGGGRGGRRVVPSDTLAFERIISCHKGGPDTIYNKEITLLLSVERCGRSEEEVGSVGGARGLSESE